MQDFFGQLCVFLDRYGMSLMQCLRMMICPETVRRRPPTMMMDIDPGLKNLNKRQRRAVIQTFFSVQSVNVINLSDKKCADEDNIDNRSSNMHNDNKKVVVVLMDDDDDDDDYDDLKTKGAPSLEICDGVENSECDPSANETIRERLARALGRRTPSSLSQMQQGQEEASLEAAIAPEINNIEIVDIENNVSVSDNEQLTANSEQTSVKKKSWWKSLFSKKKTVEDESSEESEESISALELHNDCSGSYDNEEDRATCAICLAEYETGDLVISSKMCDHLFHRDCLLEWLEKNDKCPFCRVDMVPSCVMRAAATSNFSSYHRNRRERRQNSLS